MHWFSEPGENFAWEKRNNSAPSVIANPEISPFVPWSRRRDEDVTKMISLSLLSLSLSLSSLSLSLSLSSLALFPFSSLQVILWEAQISNTDSVNQQKIVPPWEDKKLDCKCGCGSFIFFGIDSRLVEG